MNIRKREMRSVRSARPKICPVLRDYSKRGVVSLSEYGTILHHQLYLVSAYPDIVEEDEVIEFETMLSMVYTSIPNIKDYEAEYEDDCDQPNACTATQEWIHDTTKWLEFERKRVLIGRSPDCAEVFVDLVAGKIDNQEWMASHSTRLDKLEILIINRKTEALKLVAKENEGEFIREMIR